MGKSDKDASFISAMSVPEEKTPTKKVYTSDETILKGLEEITRESMPKTFREALKT